MLSRAGREKRTEARVDHEELHARANGGPDRRDLHVPARKPHMHAPSEFVPRSGGVCSKKLQAANDAQRGTNQRPIPWTEWMNLASRTSVLVVR